MKAYLQREPVRTLAELFHKAEDANDDLTLIDIQDEIDRRDKLTGGCVFRTEMRFHYDAIASLRYARKGGGK